MKEDFVNRLQTIYSEWLMEEYPEDIRCSDDLIRLEENQIYAGEFLKDVEENI